MTNIPDSEVIRIQVVHEDGTMRELSGDDAQKWAEWIDVAIRFAENNGGKSPNVDWKEYASEG